MIGLEEMRDTGNTQVTGAGTIARFAIRLKRRR